MLGSSFVLIVQVSERPRERHKICTSGLVPSSRCEIPRSSDKAYIRFDTTNRHLLLILIPLCGLIYKSK